MIGKTISHYKILEKLGEGGMGEIQDPANIKTGAVYGKQVRVLEVSML